MADEQRHAVSLEGPIVTTRKGERLTAWQIANRAVHAYRALDDRAYGEVREYLLCLRNEAARLRSVPSETTPGRGETPVDALREAWEEWMGSDEAPDADAASDQFARLAMAIQDIAYPATAIRAANEGAATAVPSEDSRADTRLDVKEALALAERLLAHCDTVRPPRNRYRSNEAWDAATSQVEATRALALPAAKRLVAMLRDAAMNAGPSASEPKANDATPSDSPDAAMASPESPDKEKEHG